MGGNNAKNSLKSTNSTPADIKIGVKCEIPLVKLSKYAISTRVFHPNKNFEKMGFRFHGDNRGFSLGESWFNKPKAKDDIPTSRIWQHYTIDLAGKPSQNVELRTESNFSDSGPWGWRVFSIGGETYEDKDYKPRGTVEVTMFYDINPCQKSVRVVSHLAGENHAFISSETQQDIAGTTVVPTLDAFNDVFLRVERVQKYIDILSLCFGDGFPNCEGYIQDEAGKRIFLGTHVRIGYPSTHLWVENDRFIWGSAIRVEIDKAGNFGEKMWVFAQLASGPPAMRDNFPVFKELEVCKKTEPKPRLANLLQDGWHASKFYWNCGDVNDIANAKTGLTPLHMSPNVSISVVRKEMEATWFKGPRMVTTVQELNLYHKQRNPNSGRDPEIEKYRVENSKWQKP